MKKTLVIGAGGQIGKILVKRLHDQGKAVVALVRNEDKAKKLTTLGIETVIRDLEDNFEFAFKDCDNVVFTAGSGGATGDDKTLLIDLWAAAKAIDYAKKNNIHHFIMVSGLGADNPDYWTTNIKPYLVAKHFADNHLIASGLNYTILRPCRLISEKGMGRIKTERPKDPYNATISREDVANVIAYCLTSEKVKGKLYELYSGNDSIESAFKNKV
jgi:uncharacterized protein YbjT (DUF2867 family)